MKPDVFDNIGRLTKIASIAILVSTYVAALAVGASYYLQRLDPPAMITVIIGSGIGYAMTQLGLQQGIVLTNSDASAALKRIIAEHEAKSGQGASNG